MPSQRRRAVFAAGRPGYHDVQKQGPPAAHRGAASADCRQKGSAMLKGFRDFVLRGKVIDLAVAVVIGVAFGAVVKAFVDNLITPLIAAIFGQPDFSGLTFTINKSKFLYGAFINAMVSFVLIAAAVYFVVVPMNKMAELRARGQAPAEATTKQCPECLSEIPHGARKCAFCGSLQDDVTPA